MSGCDDLLPMKTKSRARFNKASTRAHASGDGSAPMSYTPVPFPPFFDRFSALAPPHRARSVSKSSYPPEFLKSVINFVLNLTLPLSRAHSAAITFVTRVALSVMSRIPASAGGSSTKDSTINRTHWSLCSRASTGGVQRCRASA